MKFPFIPKATAFEVPSQMFLGEPTLPIGKLHADATTEGAL